MMPISKHLTIILTVLLISIFISSCCETSPKPDLELEPLDGQVHLTIDEGVVGDYDTIDEPKLILIMQTDPVYVCGGCVLDCDFSINGNDLNIDIKGVLITSTEGSTSRSASTVSYWDLENGIYNINVNYRETTDFVALAVTDSSFELSPSVSEEIILVEETLFWRYPKNSFIYFYRGEDFIGNYHEAYSQSFHIMGQLDFLESFIFLSSGLNPYLPMGTNGIGGIRYFKYPADQDVDEMFEAIKQAHEVIDIPEGVELGINIQTWKNEYLLVL